ncbi:hypothetical protein BRSPCE3_66320 [Bradyrhizobium sp. Ce-3]|nr:hypothetical protein BRSPCE3_66320 [Bradyrhizobium sp. Ce-3]
MRSGVAGTHGIAARRGIPNGTRTSAVHRLSETVNVHACTTGAA